jgi:hypothetical protein
MVLQSVCSLYEMKQAAYNWYQEILAFIIEEHVSSTTYDRCHFFKRFDTCLFLTILYNDDLKRRCKGIAAVELFVKKFHARLSSSDQNAGNFLGVITTKRPGG